MTILSALAQEIKSSANGYLPPNKISRKNSISPLFLYSWHYFCSLGKQNEKQGLKQCQFYYRKKRRHWYPAIINRYLPASQDSPFLFQVFKYQFLSTTLVLHWTPIFDIQSWQGLKFGKIFLTFRKLSSKDSVLGAFSQNHNVRHRVYQFFWLGSLSKLFHVNHCSFPFQKLPLCHPSL